MENAPSTLPHDGSPGRRQRDRLCQQPGRGPTGRTAGEASLRAASMASAAGGEAGGAAAGRCPPAGRRRRGVLSRQSHLRAPACPPPTPRSPRSRERQERDRQGRSEGSPFPPTPPQPPLTAARGLPHFGGGGDRRSEPAGSEPTAAPHPPPLPAVWSRPPSANQSSPLREEGFICISACGRAPPPLPLVEIYRGAPSPPSPKPRCS